MNLSKVPGGPIGAYRIEVSRTPNVTQEHRGHKLLTCQDPECGDRVEIYTTDLASCQVCGAEYFVRRRKGKWSLICIRPGKRMEGADIEAFYEELFGPPGIPSSRRG